MSCGVGHRCGSDPALPWFWRRPAAKKAPIRPLAWEPPYAKGAALEKAKRQKKKSYTGMESEWSILGMARFGTDNAFRITGSLEQYPRD